MHDAAGLRQALASARPGDVIQLMDGTYPGNFTMRGQGAAGAPITVCGSRNAVLTGSSGYTVHLEGAAHWRLVGFTIRGGQKGLVADHSVSNLIAGLLIEQIGQEGLHLRAASTDNRVQNNEVRQTGLTSAQFGEGIYVGSAKNNWRQFGGGGPDRSDRNVIEGNAIGATAAECVDIKEGTTGGILRNNSFSGAALRGAYADSWVDVKGNNWTISGNVGVDTPVDGYQVHQLVAGWGVNNRFDANTSTLGRGTGFAVNLAANPAQNVVTCNNRVSGGRGISNVQCVNAAA